jgi:hypothetical protein
MEFCRKNRESKWGWGLEFTGGLGRTPTGGEGSEESSVTRP